MALAHPGFQGAQRQIAAKEGIPMKNAGAILASSTRKASKAAKAKNPRLKKVKMPKSTPPQSLPRISRNTPSLGGFGGVQM